MNDAPTAPPPAPRGLTVNYLEDDRVAFFDWRHDPNRLLYGVVVRDRRGNELARLMSGGWQFIEHVGRTPKDVDEIVESPTTRKIVRRFFYVNTCGVMSSSYVEATLSIPLDAEGVAV